MASPSRHEGDHHFVGSVAFLSSVNLPDATVDDDAIESGANIAYSKTQTLFPLRHTQTGTVVAASEIVHVAHGDGALLSVEAVVSTVATGADRTVTVDVQKSTAGGAFATLLTTTIVLDDDSVVRVPEAGVVSGTPTFIDGDILSIIVTVAGSAGAQAAGLCVTAMVYEKSA